MGQGFNYLHRSISYLFWRHCGQADNAGPPLTPSSILPSRIPPRPSTIDSFRNSQSRDLHVIRPKSAARHVAPEHGLLLVNRCRSFLRVRLSSRRRSLVCCGNWMEDGNAAIIRNLPTTFCCFDDQSSLNVTWLRFMRFDFGTWMLSSSWKKKRFAVSKNKMNRI